MHRKNHSRKTFWHIAAAVHFWTPISYHVFFLKDETVWVEAVLLHYRNRAPDNENAQFCGANGEVDGIFPPSFPPQGKGFWLECLERLGVKLEKKW